MQRSWVLSLLMMIGCTVGEPGDALQQAGAANPSVVDVDGGASQRWYGVTVENRLTYYTLTSVDGGAVQPMQTGAGSNGRSDAIDTAMTTYRDTTPLDVRRGTLTS